MKKKIAIGSDHAGFALKEKIKKWLQEQGYAVSDFGCFSAESCDYPDFAEKVAKEVAKDRNTIGILFCGTGIGMCIAANKIKGIHAALIHNEFTGRSAREHNNANIICLGARVINFATAKKAISAFLNAEFQGGRHSRRVKKIKRLER
ncbi:MAG: ribose 5-phosphate isomerase B [Candidatus Diapherotrites archaeon]|nr:ribose 5-phosphate isomerase B [Candidatus Diapherotrites archaeon]